MRFLTILFVLFVTSNYLNSQEINLEKTALVLIDIQNFYFPGGKSELVEPEKASENAAVILTEFRGKEMLVVHVRHNFEPGGEIHRNVEPEDGEQVFTKDEVNAFNGTQLKQYLDKNGIEQLVLVGMQTHMCLEGTTRAAYDLGYHCIVVGDACATKDLNYNEHVVRAIDVHNSTLKTLESYATVLSTDAFLMVE